MPSALDVTILFFLQIAITLAACHALGKMLKRLGQPQVVADMVAGFTLGPTFLGIVLPGLQERLFPAVLSLPSGDVVTHPNLTLINVVGHLGLVLYMFVVGLTFDGKVLRKHRKSAATSSISGIIVPLVAGGALGYLLAQNSRIFDSDVLWWQASLFVGASMAITAFPMLARIIQEKGLQGTRVGTVSLSCAAADDAVAWVLLAVVVATLNNDPAVAVLALVGGGGYVVCMILFGGKVMRRLLRGQIDRSTVQPAALSGIFMALLLAAAFADYVGIYAVVGAFIFGAVFPRGELSSHLRAVVEPISNRLLLPLFFVSAGLKTSLDLLFKPEVLIALVAVLVVAFVAKAGACTVGGRLAGLSWRDSAAVGALMNARGLMELILLDVGLQAGIVTPALYTILAIMAITTTFAASPLYAWIARRRPDEDEKDSAVGHDPGHSRANVGVDEVRVKS